MCRAILAACLPYAALLGVAFVCAWALLRLAHARVQPRRVARLHDDVQGTAQSLSFVLTLPFFIMILLFIVQVSELMIGAIVVHYAAFAAARSAAVWIPADMRPAEGP